MTDLLADAISRDMRPTDLASVLQIERHVQISPWSRLSFEEALTRMEGSGLEQPEALELLDERSVRNYLCRVVMVGEVLAGFHIGSTILDELHILNLAVAPSYQGMGIGHVIMDDFRQLTIKRNLTRQFLEVRATNAVAQALYTKWGFEQIAVRKDYYRLAQGGREDACVYVNNGLKT